ncbi:winged helix-turn-helix transcriptional regulator [Sphingopyxis chilensis]|uniref:winged helix-turn-helix transcriptional regulator n=1 Tax=Sphingopyxis chilensis TaxID=180400 RepID=UPI002DDCB58C|nr:helix-turn-helix domain-containing protein [Sphingopyxis chilensis]
MKGKRTDLGTTQCGIARSLGVIGDWWSLLIIRDAFIGLEHFGEFHRSLGLARNILSTRLKKLVEHGIFRIEPDEDNASSHRYLLTERGKELYIVIMALCQWGENGCFAPDEKRYLMIDRKLGRPLAPLELRADDGRILGPDDFRHVSPQEWEGLELGRLEPE